MRSSLRKICKTIVYLGLLTYALSYVLIARYNHVNKYNYGNKIDQVTTNRYMASSNRSSESNHSAVITSSLRYNNNKQINNTSNWAGEDLKLYLKPLSKNVSHLCEDKLTIYSATITVFKNITIIPELADISDKNKKGKGTFAKAEDLEIFRLHKGFFSMNCLSAIDNHLLHSRYKNKNFDQLRSGFSTYTNSSAFLSKYINKTERVDYLTVTLVRMEYANVYWTLMDLYDIFLTTIFLNRTVSQTNILLLDARPPGHLDALWNVFKSVRNPSDIKAPTVFTELNWLYARAKSPMLQKSLQPLPFINQFRKFFLNANNITSEHKHKCDTLNVLFIWRRNYVAHPRNPSGKVSRKIRNENELLSAVKTAFPKYHIQGIQLDLLNISTQLHVLAETDIYVGMHGAGMAYSVLLPPKSGVLELFPQYYGALNWHMHYLALRSGHIYLQWKNKNPALEDVKSQSTIVSPGDIISLLKKIVEKMCP